MNEAFTCSLKSEFLCVGRLLEFPDVSRSRIDCQSVCFLLSAHSEGLKSSKFVDIFQPHRQILLIPLSPSEWQVHYLILFYFTWSHSANLQVKHRSSKRCIFPCRVAAGLTATWSWALLFIQRSLTTKVGLSQWNQQDRKYLKFWWIRREISLHGIKLKSDNMTEVYLESWMSCFRDIMQLSLYSSKTIQTLLFSSFIRNRR